MSAGASSSTTVSELVAMRDAPQEVGLLHRCSAVQHVAGQARQGSVCIMYVKTVRVFHQTWYLG